MRRKDRDRVRTVQVSRHCLYDHRALVGVRAARELVDQKQRIALFDFLQRGVEPHDLGTEAGKTRLHGLRVVEQHVQTVKHRNTRRFCTDQKARVHQQHVQRDGLHRDALAAHVRAGDDRCAAVGGDRNGHERTSFFAQKIDKLRVNHVDELQRGLRNLGAHAAVFLCKQRLLDQNIEPSRGVRVRTHGGNAGEKRVAHRFADLPLFGVLVRAHAQTFRADRVLFRVRPRLVQPLLQKLFLSPDRAKRLRRAVGNIKPAGARVLRIEHVERAFGIGKSDAFGMCGLVHPGKQRDQLAHAQQKPLELKQLHVIETRALGKPLDRAAHILHLTQHEHDLFIERTERVRRVLCAFRVAELGFQLVPLIRRIEAKLPHAFDAERTARMQTVRNVLQTDFHFIVKADRDHVAPPLH